MQQNQTFPQATKGRYPMQLAIQNPTLAARSIMSRVQYGTRNTPVHDAAINSLAPAERPFRHLSEFLAAVVNAGNAGKSGYSSDVRLTDGYQATIPTTSGAEHRGGGVDGGFLVPPQFVGDVASKIFSPESLLMHC